MEHGMSLLENPQNPRDPSSCPPAILASFWLAPTLSPLPGSSPRSTGQTVTSFKSYVCVCMFSHVQLFVTPWTVPTSLLCPWNFSDKNTSHKFKCNFLRRPMVNTLFHGNLKAPYKPSWSSLTSLLPFDLIALATLQHNIQFTFQHSLHLLSRSSLWGSWDGNSMPKWIFVLITNGLVGHKGAHCIVCTQRFAEWIKCPYVLINKQQVASVEKCLSHYST